VARSFGESALLLFVGAYTPLAVFRATSVETAAGAFIHLVLDPATVLRDLPHAQPQAEPETRPGGTAGHRPARERAGPARLSTADHPIPAESILMNDLLTGLAFALLAGTVPLAGGCFARAVLDSVTPTAHGATTAAEGARP
jgi:hypothetical protein